MDIFFTNINKFKQTHDRAFLSNYADIELKNEKRFYEYTIGRYMVKYIAQNIYNIKDTCITVNASGKPVFKESKLYFNISHSKEYIVVCFDYCNCAIDIEYIKPRNLEKLSKYLKKKFENLEDFYKFWTQKEAVYKLNGSSKGSFSGYFKEDYYLTVLSENKIKEINYNEVF